MKHASFLTVSAVVALLVFAAPANATHVSCGDTVTQDTTLDSNVVCPDTFTELPALTIGASDVRLDLAGFTVRAGASGGSEGILSGGSGAVFHERNLILNGRIEGFDTGVSVGGGDHHIRRLTISATTLGIGVIGTGGGAGLANCQRDVSICVVRNVIDIAPGGQQGIAMGGVGNHAFGNTVRGAPQGIIATGDKTRINLNRVENCSIAGIDVESEFRVTYAIIWGNTVVNCPGAFGIFVFGENARVRSNTVTGTGIGIHVNDGVRAVVAQNDSSGNADTGIETQGNPDVPTLVQQNNADNNGSFGISAHEGAIDGGGNTASGNGVQNCSGNLACGP